MIERLTRSQRLMRRDQANITYIALMVVPLAVLVWAIDIGGEAVFGLGMAMVILLMVLFMGLMMNLLSPSDKFTDEEDSPGINAREVLELKTMISNFGRQALLVPVPGSEGYDDAFRRMIHARTLITKKLDSLVQLNREARGYDLDE